ncbi:MAG: arylformamidase [Acidobacteriota bacterium]
MRKAAKLYDISPLLAPAIAVWPGDAPFQRSQSLSISQGASVNLSSMSLSLHTGAHADAPSHFDDQGATIEDVDLEAYIGPARLVTVEAQETVSAQDLRPVLEDRPQRLLVRCNPDFDPRRFPPRFVHFSPEAAQAIGQAGARLVGLDAPSVDFVDSQELPCHHIFQRHGTAILENLLLKGVPDGEYELIALPLRIAGGDASPVRAVLRRSN